VTFQTIKKLFNQCPFWSQSLEISFRFSPILGIYDPVLGDNLEAFPIIAQILKAEFSAVPKCPIKMCFVLNQLISKYFGRIKSSLHKVKYCFGISMKFEKVAAFQRPF